MASQGFFSGSESAEKRSGRLAGQKENKVASSLSGGSSGGNYVDAGDSRGFVSKDQAERMLTNPEAYKMRPSETKYLRESLGLPRASAGDVFGGEVAQIASSDLSNLKIGSPEVRLANVKSYTDNLTKPYAPDILDSILKDTKLPEKRYLDSSGDYFDKKPYTETDTGAKFYSGTDAKIIQRKGDDMRFSQPYSRDDKGELTKNYQKEYKSYLKSGESPFGVGFSDAQAHQVAYGETPRTTEEKLGAFFFNKDKYMPKSSEMTTRMLTKPEFDQYRKDLVKTAAEKSMYGADVEVGSKRFVEETGFDKYVRNPDFTYTKTGEKYNQLQDTNIPKGEGYFFKDFYKPGEFRTKEDLNRYLTDRGAYMTNMPSNFEGGISGKGEKTDDLTSMYRSTAGDEKTRLEKAKEEQENKNILQRVGDFVGDTFNKLTGTQAAGAETLQAQGINTSATTNIAQMGNVDPATQIARDAVAKANLRKSGLDKTVGGKSSQANYGSGRTGGFGTGTHGKGMPSNPGSQRQTGVGVSAGNLSRHKAGPSVSRGGISRSTSRGQGGGSSSRSRGGTGSGGGGGSQGRGGRRGGSTGGSGSSSKGGTGSGRTSTSRTASKASRSRTGRSRSQCDIRTKIDISPLINSNLVKDNLAEVAYFVQEIKK